LTHIRKKIDLGFYVKTLNRQHGRYMNSRQDNIKKIFDGNKIGKFRRYLYVSIWRIMSELKKQDNEYLVFIKFREILK